MPSRSLPASFPLSTVTVGAAGCAATGVATAASKAAKARVLCIMTAVFPPHPIDGTHYYHRADLLCYYSITHLLRQPSIRRSPGAIQTHAIAAIVPSGRHDDRSGPRSFQLSRSPGRRRARGAKETHVPLFTRGRAASSLPRREPGQVGMAAARTRSARGSPPETVKCGSNQATRKMRYFNSENSDVPTRWSQDTLTKNTRNQPRRYLIFQRGKRPYEIRYPGHGSQKCASRKCTTGRGLPRLAPLALSIEPTKKRIVSNSTPSVQIRPKINERYQVPDIASRNAEILDIPSNSHANFRVSPPDSHKARPVSVLDGKSSPAQPGRLFPRYQLSRFAPCERECCGFIRS